MRKLVRTTTTGDLVEDAIDEYGREINYTATLRDLDSHIDDTGCEIESTSSDLEAYVSVLRATSGIGDEDRTRLADAIEVAISTLGVAASALTEASIDVGAALNVFESLGAEASVSIDVYEMDGTIIE